MPDLAGWLIVSAVMLAWGLLAALVDRGEHGMLAGVVLSLAAVVVAAAALVRYAVLPAGGLVALLLVPALGAVLVLVAAIMVSAKDPS